MNNLISELTEYYYELYQKKTGIMQYDQGISREIAEKRAFYDVVNYYRSQNRISCNDKKSREFVKNFKKIINKKVEND